MSDSGSQLPFLGKEGWLRSFSEAAALPGWFDPVSEDVGAHRTLPLPFPQQAGGHWFVCK